jgi:hypothetical protein
MNTTLIVSLIAVSAILYAYTLQYTRRRQLQRSIPTKQ